MAANLKRKFKKKFRSKQNKKNILEMYSSSGLLQTTRKGEYSVFK